MRAGHPNKGKGRPKPAFLVFFDGYSGLVAFLFNFNFPFCTGFSVAVDLSFALLFDELISVIVERSNKRVNARRRGCFCDGLCEDRLCRLHTTDERTLTDETARRVNK